MRGPVALLAEVGARVDRQVRTDLRADPALLWILLLALVLTSFWFWHRIPNFATRDERWRIVDPMETIGFVRADPSLEGVREGLTYWRTYGATLHLAGVVSLPVFAYLFLTGEFGVFETTTRAWSLGLWAHWLDVPGWLWTATLLIGRLTIVGFAVGSVYLMYRIGTVVDDRSTGRLASLLFSLTWGFLVLAHEVGEDVPALFFFLLGLYGVLEYVNTGHTRWFYAACLAGGVAIGFKLSAGVTVPLIGVGYLLRARRAGDGWIRPLYRPRLLAVGLACGLGAIVLSYPGVIVGGPDVFIDRIGRGVDAKTALHRYREAPSWWWLLRGSLHGLGLPLFVAVVASVPPALSRVRERSLAADAIVLATVGVAVYRLIYSLWSYIRPHHLLPVFALAIVVLAVVFARWLERRPALVRPVLAVLVVTTALYAGVGVLGYASQPRDEATSWVASHAGPDATVETYALDPQEAAVPHDFRVYRPTRRVVADTRYDSVDAWMRAMPARCPDFVVLNAHESLQYLAPNDYSRRARIQADDERRAYIRDLLDEDTYPYEVVGRFGPEPRYLRASSPRSTWTAVLRAGVIPRTVQYGDGQDMGPDQYTIVLERSGHCTPAH